MPLYLKFKSAQKAPSMVAPMSLKEFAMRAQKDSDSSPLFYPDGEFYYMQSPVTRDMRCSGDLNFEQPPFSVVLAAGMCLFHGTTVLHNHVLADSYHGAQHYSTLGEWTFCLYVFLDVCAEQA